jgi:hypothetical protein
MKLTKMSLVAALLVGSSAFAVDNIKVSGDAQVVYETTDAKGMTSNDVGGALAGNPTTKSGTLFDKDSSGADAALHLGLTADLAKNDLVTVSAGAKMTVISTLGLENNFVSNVWAGSHGTPTLGTTASYATDAGGAKVENANWFNEAYVVVSSGKSILKVGRQELDTPLAFTETWSIEQNSFEAAAFINQDLPDTTIVAAYVGNGNGAEFFGQDLNAAANNTVTGLGLAMGPIVNPNGNFTTYGTNGAYALGVINNSFKPLTVQAWYYDVSKLASAVWLQADLNMDGIMAGVQYNTMTLDASGADTNSVVAAMLGYDMKDVVTIKAAYSANSSTGSLGHCGFNTAVNANSAQSKLYTEAWWNYGNVTIKDNTAMNLTVESPVNGLLDLGVYYTMVDNAAAKSVGDLTELTVTAGKDFGPLNATLAVINAKVGTGDATNTVQAYITVNF